MDIQVQETRETPRSERAELTVRRSRRALKRIQKWDNLKAFLIFCVVFGHIADVYTLDFEEMRKVYFFIYIYHMPLFIFVSGLFAKKAINRSRIDKILGYFVLYMVMKAGFFLYTAQVSHNYNILFLTERTVPWFMMVLGIYMGVTMLIKRVAPNYVLTVSIFLACFAGYNAQIGDFLALSRVFVFYPFYYLGYIMNRETIEAYARKPLLKIISLVIVGAALFVVIRFGEEIYWLRPLFTGRNSFYELKYFTSYGWLCRLLYYPLSMLVSAAIVILTPERTPFGLLSKIGQQTLGVFVFHPFLLAIIMTLLDFRWGLLMIPPFFGIWNTAPFALVVTLFLSIPLFTMLANRVMVVPMRPTIKR